MFTVTICSELIPQNILQLKLTYLVTFKNLLLSKVVQNTHTHGAPTVPTYKLSDRSFIRRPGKPGRHSRPFTLKKKKKKYKFWAVIKQGIFMSYRPFHHEEMASSLYSYIKEWQRSFPFVQVNPSDIQILSSTNEILFWLRKI